MLRGHVRIRGFTASSKLRVKIWTGKRYTHWRELTRGKSAGEFRALYSRKLFKWEY